MPKVKPDKTQPARIVLLIEGQPYAYRQEGDVHLLVPEHRPSVTHKCRSTPRRETCSCEAMKYRLWEQEGGRCKHLRALAAIGRIPAELPLEGLHA